MEGEVGLGRVKLTNDEGGESTILEVNESVELQFALRYLNIFNKACTLSPQTRLCLHPEQPLVIEYHMEDIGGLRFYLAPKISDE